MSRKDWRVVVTEHPGFQPLPPVHYRSRATALAGAVWHAEQHPSGHVRVQRYDPLVGRYVGYTETRGADLR